MHPVRHAIATYQFQAREMPLPLRERVIYYRDRLLENSGGDIPRDVSDAAYAQLHVLEPRVLALTLSRAMNALAHVVQLDGWGTVATAMQRYAQLGTAWDRNAPSWDGATLTMAGCLRHIETLLTSMLKTYDMTDITEPIDDNDYRVNRPVQPCNVDAVNYVVTNYMLPSLRIMDMAARAFREDDWKEHMRLQKRCVRTHPQSPEHMSAVALTAVAELFCDVVTDAHIPRVRVDTTLKLFRQHLLEPLPRD